MARGRMISKSLSSSQRFAALYERAGKLAEFCQALFPLIVAHSDDFGRLQGDPFTVKHQVLPVSSRKLREFQGALEALHDVGLIIWYEGDDGRKFLQVCDFDAHQSGLHRRTKSAFPEPPGNSGKFREIPSEEKRTEQKGREQNGREKSPGAVLEIGAVDGSLLWRSIIERLELSDYVRREWFDVAVVERVTPDLIEVRAIPVVAEHLAKHFKPRILKECSDLIGKRGIGFRVVAHEAAS